MTSGENLERVTYKRRMGKEMKRIKVDIQAIKEYLRENGMTQVDVCRRIG